MPRVIGVEEQKESEVEYLSYAEEWLDNLINDVKPILAKIAEDTFTRYRQIGKMILKSGYKKGQWKSKHKRKFIKELGISGSTFSLFVRLAEISDKEFKKIKDTYSSVNEWYRRGKPKQISDERKALLSSLIENFPEQSQEIKEILRTEKPYLKEKDLGEFSRKVFLGNQTPMEAFVKYYYLTSDSKIKLPMWILVGFQIYLEKTGLDQDLDATIFSALNDILLDEGITQDEIEKAAKNMLRSEWGIQ